VSVRELRESESSARWTRADGVPRPAKAGAADFPEPERVTEATCPPRTPTARDRSSIFAAPALPAAARPPHDSPGARRSRISTRDKVSRRVKFAAPALPAAA